MSKRNLGRICVMQIMSSDILDSRIRFSPHIFYKFKIKKRFKLALKMLVALPN